MKNYIKEIIEAFAHNDYSDDINHRVWQWMANDEHVSEKDEALHQLWEEAHCCKSPRDMNVSIRSMYHYTGIKHGFVGIGYRIWQVAAVLFFIVSSVSVYWLVKGDVHRQVDLIQSYIPCAEMRTITLPDGTVVRLNSESTLLYPSEFKGETRSVYLLGEANFKVKSDKKHPFIVKSSDFQVTALGTEFQVSAYPNDDEIAATLLSGSIKVEYDNLASNMILSPNEQLVYNKQTKVHQLLHPDMEDETAWQRGELIFSCMDIEDILTCLERKFPYSFVYSLNSLKRDTYSFRFPENATLQNVMDIITQVTDMEYKIIDKKCYLMQKKK